MAVLITVLMLLGQLGLPIVDAEATGMRSGDRSEVDLEVGLEALNVATVLAHINDPGGEQTTMPLNDRGNGRYGAIITLPAADVVVVFEALAPGDSVLSQPTTLTALGLDGALLEPDRAFANLELEREPAANGLSPAARRWGWAAVGLLAASLALLAVWAAGPRRGQADDGDESAPDEAGSAESTGPGE